MSPGKLSYASTGIGTPQHLAGHLFAQQAGVDVIHVPFKGGAPALTALLGGEPQIAFIGVPPTLPHVRQGAHKLIHHVDGPIQYFDLAADPEELVDRATDADAAPERNRLAALLGSIIDPRAVDARAKGRQAELRSIAGGDAAILARQDYGYSPVPAEALVPHGIGTDA